jgi:hypothetical protein
MPDIRETASKPTKRNGNKAKYSKLINKLVKVILDSKKGD